MTDEPPAGNPGDEPDERSPWVSIWTQPRRTIRRIVDTNPRHFVLLLAGLAGIGNALDRASARNLGDKMETDVIVGLAVVFGIFGGIIGLYIVGAVVWWTGQWIGGKATPEAVRASMAWANVPVIASLVLWIPMLTLYGRDLFSTEMPTLDENPVAAVGFAVAGVVLGVWSFILMLKCLGEVQGFSAWKALGNLLLAGLVFLVPIGCLVLPALLSR